MTDDRRLIEDYIPLKAISEEAAREKKDSKGKIAAIHQWWARRPVTAARAAVYGVLVPAPEGKNGRGGRRIEVKGRIRGQPIRLTTNEWYKAMQLGDTYWPYVVWDPLNNPDPTPVMIQNPAKHLDHAKREIVSARYYDLAADAIEQVARRQEASDQGPVL
jgi:hypothetical protein